MQYRVLDTADILVHGKPVIDRAFVQSAIRMGAGKAGKIPGRFKKRIEGIGFTLRVLATLGAGGGFPSWMIGQRVAGRTQINFVR